MAGLSTLCTKQRGISDVEVTRLGHNVTCVRCTVQSGCHLEFTSRWAMLDHLQAHKDHGDLVPNDVIDKLRRDD
jgi:hypothetical protein